MHALLTRLIAHPDQRPTARGITPGYLATLVRASSRVHAAPACHRGTLVPGTCLGRFHLLAHLGVTPTPGARS